MMTVTRPEGAQSALASRYLCTAEFEVGGLDALRLPKWN